MYCSEFGPAALPLFNDLTTDLKLNPNPKPDEIVLCFRSDFEEFAPSVNEAGLSLNNWEGLQALYTRKTLLAKSPY